MEGPTLSGRWVALEPLSEADRNPLRRAANDERIGPPRSCARTDKACVGSTSYLDIAPAHRRIEIGATWYHPDCWGTMVNPECKLLLLTHAFEVLGVQRVTFITDVNNARSQAAIAKGVARWPNARWRGIQHHRRRMAPIRQALKARTAISE